MYLYFNVKFVVLCNYLTKFKQTLKIMKKLDLNEMGLVEMNAHEMEETIGGNSWLNLIALVVIVILWLDGKHLLG
jgi:hypothetical protein